jgi:hypothetical protein
MLEEDRWQQLLEHRKNNKYWTTNTQAAERA